MGITSESAMDLWELQQFMQRLLVFYGNNPSIYRKSKLNEVSYFHVFFLIRGKFSCIYRITSKFIISVFPTLSLFLSMSFCVVNKLFRR